MADISRSIVSIRLFGSELNPEKIAQLLGCEPSSAAKTGEKIIKRNGQEIVNYNLTEARRRQDSINTKSADRCVKPKGRVRG